MKKGLLITTALLLAVLAYAVATPYLAVDAMRKAAEANDAQALATHVDFVAVRQSLKTQINVLLANELAKQKIPDSLWRALGANFADTMMDQLLQAYISPQGITLMMSGEKPTTTAAVASVPLRKPFADSSMAYASPDRFVVRVRNNRDEMQFVLHRQGFSWKLSEIILPL